MLSTHDPKNDVPEPEIEPQGIIIWQPELEPEFPQPEPEPY